MLTEFRSTVKSDTLSPVWNELWKVKNVPSNATLHVRVMDKDNDQPMDGHIGTFETTVNSGTKEVEIEGSILHRARGNFWFKVSSCQCLNLRTITFSFGQVDRVQAVRRRVRSYIPLSLRRPHPFLSPFLANHRPPHQLERRPPLFHLENVHQSRPSVFRRLQAALEP